MTEMGGSYRLRAYYEASSLAETKSLRVAVQAYAWLSCPARSSRRRIHTERAGLSPCPRPSLASPRAGLDPPQALWPFRSLPSVPSPPPPLPPPSCATPRTDGDRARRRRDPNEPKAAARAQVSQRPAIRALGKPVRPPPRSPAPPPPPPPPDPFARSGAPRRRRPDTAACAHAGAGDDSTAAFSRFRGHVPFGFAPCGGGAIE